MNVSYTWLKEYLGDSAPTPKEIEELLTFHAFEIEEVKTVGEDTVIDVDVLPNRSSDCLCHRGIAREIATVTGQSLVHDPLAATPQLTATDAITVDIQDGKACPRFTASLITGVEVKESPQWLKDRLAALGQRSINTIVDATNYVMYAIGQPLHAYDATKFPQTNGKWQFVVRRAQAGETISLLAEGGKDEDRIVELIGTELLIVDGSSNTPIGLAGVKGGRFAGVDATTTQIIVEAAHFDPTLTRQTARRLGIVIDASKRFENEPSRELPLYAQAEIIELITRIAGGASEGVIDVFLEPKVSPSVLVRPDKVNALLGSKLTKEEMVALVERLGAAVAVTSDGFTTTGPFERTDLNIEEDYIEEIGRMYGLSNVQSVVPKPVPLTEVNARQYYSDQIRHILLDLGFSEMITTSFRKKDQIQLQNALASDKSCLRSTLRKNLMDVLDKNAALADLLGTTDTRVFEIGTVFEKTDAGVTEHVSLALGVRIKQSGYTGKEDRPCDEALAAISSALGASFPAIAKGGQTLAEDRGQSFVYNQGVAEVNLSELIAKLPKPTAYESVATGVDVTYQPFSVYPYITRDIALWTKDVFADEVKAVLNEHAGDLRVRTTLFDEFQKDGRTSYAFRLVFQSKEKTLTDTEVNAIMDTITSAVTARGWEVR